jgi:processive 1,2-diacylglycerol beta-glucosyltransferase
LKALLITASFGDGHNQAANAVAQALRNRGVTVRVADYTEWLNPALRSFAKFSLIQGVQKAPVLYGLFYRSMSRLNPDSSLQRQLNHLGRAQMKRCLHSFRPDVVASTFPTPTGVLSEMRVNGQTNVPMAAILTDYTVHGQWVQDATDLYCVATDTAKYELMAYSIEEERIAVTGIPIREQFTDLHASELLKRRTSNRQAERLRSDKPLILLMGGGSGLLGDINEWMSVIKSIDLQFCVICGRNERLYKKLRQLHSDRVRVLGYVTDVDRWMSMADLIITKPGGITLTEALSMELPMLLFRPIPGQEEQNAAFALQCGVAQLAYDVKSASRLLQSFVESPEVLRSMRESTKRVQVRDGAVRIAELLMDLAGRESVQLVGSNTRPRLG